MKVALTTDEIIKYGSLGVRRCANALDVGRTGAHGFNREDDRWNIDVEGVLCEYAAAKALGIDYDPIVDGLDTLLGEPLGSRQGCRPGQVHASDGGVGGLHPAWLDLWRGRQA